VINYQQRECYKCLRCLHTRPSLIPNRECPLVFSEYETLSRAVHILRLQVTEFKGISDTPVSVRYLEVRTCEK
jgi:hypothetical protein